MTSSAIRATPPTPNLRHAFGGVWRLTFPSFCSFGALLRLAALLAGLALITLAATRHPGTHTFFDWTVKFYLTFLLPVLAFLSGAGAVRNDLQSATVDYVFTRPLPRPAYLAFKYLAHTAGVQAHALLALGVLLAVGVFRQVPGLLAALPLLVVAQMLAVGVFSSFGFLCGTLTARHLVLGLAYGGVIEVGIGNIPTQLSRLSLTHQLQSMLLPLSSATVPGALPAQGMLATSTLLIFIAAVMLALAAFVFGLRELAGGRPKDS